MTKQGRKKLLAERIRKRLCGESHIMVGDIVRVSDEVLPVSHEGKLLLHTHIARVHFIGATWLPLDGAAWNIGLYFDEGSIHLHNLANHCEGGHGWWVPMSALTIIKRVEEE